MTRLNCRRVRIWRESRRRRTSTRRVPALPGSIRVDPAIVDGDRVTFRIGLELKSPNAWLWTHWRVKHLYRQQWQDALERALPVTVRASMAAVSTPRRLTITRLAPSRRHFIRDEDNAMFAGKAIRDGLVSLGVLKDDSWAWLENAPLQQVVAPDRQWLTVIVVEPMPTKQATA